MIRKDNLSQIVLEHVEPYHIEYFDFTHKLNIEDEIFKVREQLEHQNFNPYQWPSFDIKYLDLPKNKVGYVLVLIIYFLMDIVCFNYSVNGNIFILILMIQYNLMSRLLDLMYYLKKNIKTDIYKKDLAY